MCTLFHRLWYFSLCQTVSVFVLVNNVKQNGSKMTCLIRGTTWTAVEDVAEILRGYVIRVMYLIMKQVTYWNDFFFFFSLFFCALEFTLSSQCLHGIKLNHTWRFVITWAIVHKIKVQPTWYYDVYLNINEWVPLI